MSIIEQFNREGFNRIYRGTVPFCDTRYFDKFLELLKDEKTLEHIKFANDTLGIAPVKSMIFLHRTFFNEKMKPQEKQGLGACFGYLYKHIYNEGYAPVQTWVGDSATSIKTASAFIKVGK